MKKILAIFSAVLLSACLFVGNVAKAATPDEALAFFNKYINAANTYSDTIVNYYAPDAKIIREGKDKEQIGRKYLKNTYPIKDVQPKYTKKS